LENPTLGIGNSEWTVFARGAGMPTLQAEDFLRVNIPALFDLSGRKALVTGASRGIGQAISEALASAGADVAVTARDHGSLSETIRRIESHGRAGHALVLDVRDIEACGKVIADAADALGGLDILVNNAGHEEIRPSLDVDEMQWDKIVDTNLKGAFFCAQAAVRCMVELGRGGAIVNLCSLTSYVGVPTAVPYGSSKSGLMGMTHALATEWAGLNIRVNAIAPGYFRTAMTDVFYRDEGWQQAMLAKIPQRRFGALEDVAGAVVFLVSDASAYVTGTCLPIDGGYLASI
jgi:NAD(P)-dependent dehydrogenase (short-subunit alcohol dehydrogenase family)